MGEAMLTLNEIGTSGMAALAMFAGFLTFIFWACSQDDSAQGIEIRVVDNRSVNRGDSKTVLK
jgi:hypothetical protein